MKMEMLLSVPEEEGLKVVEKHEAWCINTVHEPNLLSPGSRALPSPRPTPALQVVPSPPKTHWPAR